MPSCCLLEIHQVSCPRECFLSKDLLWLAGCLSLKILQLYNLTWLLIYTTPCIFVSSIMRFCSKFFQVTTNYSNSFQVRITVIYSVKISKPRNFIKPIFSATMLKYLLVGFHDFMALTWILPYDLVQNQTVDEMILFSTLGPQTGN